MSVNSKCELILPHRALALLCPLARGSDSLITLARGSDSLITLARGSHSFITLARGSHSLRTTWYKKG